MSAYPSSIEEEYARGTAHSQPQLLKNGTPPTRRNSDMIHQSTRAIALLLIVLQPLASADEEVLEPDSVEVQAWRQSKWRCYQTVTLEHLSGFKPRDIQLSAYGGRMDRKEAATGFFHTRQIEGRWLLVDPEGCHYINMGVNSTTPNDSTRDSKLAFADRFGTTGKWARETGQLFRGLGFNGLGCWSGWQIFNESGTPMPYVRRWNMISSYARSQGVTHRKYGHTGFDNDVLPVFDADFRRFCHQKMGDAIASTKDDPYLIGHFSDNELPLKERNIIKRYLKAGEPSESRKAALKWLEEQGRAEHQITASDDRAFCGLVTATYYRTCREVLKQHDPNHLYMGSRLHGSVAKQDVTYEACGPHVDVVSVNLYHRWSPVQADLDRWAKLSGKPLVITEWYAKGMDSNLPVRYGAGFAVRTQGDRGRFYENFTIGLLSNPHVVGWHWFRYMDDGPLDHKEKASNKGLLDVTFNEWEPLTRSMRAINLNAYTLQDHLLELPEGSLPRAPTRAK